MSGRGEIRLSDYLLEQAGHDWAGLLKSYAPPLPAEFTVFIVTRFLDFFLTFADGSIHWLDTGGASISRVADNRSEFETKIETEYSNWLSVELVDEAIALGMTLQSGQCY